MSVPTDKAGDFHFRPVRHFTFSLGCSKLMLPKQSHVLTQAIPGLLVNPPERRVIPEKCNHLTKQSPLVFTLKAFEQVIASSVF